MRSVKDLLEESGKTKSSLARELGCSRQTLYSKLVSQDWSLDEAYKLAKFLGCTVDDIHEASRA